MGCARTFFQLRLLHPSSQCGPKASRSCSGADRTSIKHRSLHVFYHELKLILFTYGYLGITGDGVYLLLQLLLRHQRKMLPVTVNAGFQLHCTVRFVIVHTRGPRTSNQEDERPRRLERPASLEKYTGDRGWVLSLLYIKMWHGSSSTKIIAHAPPLTFPWLTESCDNLGENTRNNRRSAAAQWD